MLAAIPYTPPRGGRVICGLAMLADPDRAAADANVPALDEPIVETGGGLRVYRRPPLQSAAGRELILPAGAGEAAPALDPKLERLRERVAAAINDPEPEEATSG